MTYDSREISATDGASIRLYEFVIGTQTWRWCNGDRDGTYGGKFYTAAPISDGGLKQKGTAITDDFIVTMPSYFGVPALFRATPPSEPIRFTMRQAQQAEPTEALIMWLGYVSSCKYKDDIVSEVLCNTQTAYLNRRGLRLAYSRECPHALYDDDCRVDKALWAEPIKVTATNGIAVVYEYLAPPRSDNRVGRFTNGFIEWQVITPGGGKFMQRRSIHSHEIFQGVNAFQLLGQTDGIVIGMTLVAYPGCQRNTPNCKLFDNIANYGGFPFLPGKSPFDGEPIF